MKWYLYLFDPSLVGIIKTELSSLFYFLNLAIFLILLLFLLEFSMNNNAIFVLDLLKKLNVIINNLHHKIHESLNLSNFQVIFGCFEITIDWYLQVRICNSFSVKPQLFEKLQISKQKKYILNLSKILTESFKNVFYPIPLKPFYRSGWN